MQHTTPPAAVIQYHELCPYVETRGIGPDLSHRANESLAGRLRAWHDTADLLHSYLLSIHDTLQLLADRGVGFPLEQRGILTAHIAGEAVALSNDVLRWRDTIEHGDLSQLRAVWQEAQRAATTAEAMMRKEPSEQVQQWADHLRDSHARLGELAMAFLAFIEGEGTR